MTCRKSDIACYRSLSIMLDLECLYSLVLSFACEVPRSPLPVLGVFYFAFLVRKSRSQQKEAGSNNRPLSLTYQAFEHHWNQPQYPLLQKIRTLSSISGSYIMWNLFSYVASVHSLLSAPAKRVIISDEEKALQDGYIQAAAEEDLLVVSPYTRRPHLLDLTNLTKSQTYLAKALTRLSPLTHAYATVPYVKAFNWDVVFGSLAAAVKADGFSWTEQFFFIVVFRSQVPPSTDRSHLAELDKKAHMEAMASGGLFKYWFGVPDHDGRNLATCGCPLIAVLESVLTLWEAFGDDVRTLLRAVAEKATKRLCVQPSTCTPSGISSASSWSSATMPSNGILSPGQTERKSCRLLFQLLHLHCSMTWIRFHPKGTLKTCRH